MAVAQKLGTLAEASQGQTDESTWARRVVGRTEQLVRASALRDGDCIVVSSGEPIVAAGKVIDGVAFVDAAAITGESTPILCEAGGERSSVGAGTRVVSGCIIVRIGTRSHRSFGAWLTVVVQRAARPAALDDTVLVALLVGFAAVLVFACVLLVGLAS